MAATDQHGTEVTMVKSRLLSACRSVASVALFIVLFSSPTTFEAQCNSNDCYNGCEFFTHLVLNNYYCSPLCCDETIEICYGGLYCYWYTCCGFAGPEASETSRGVRQDVRGRSPACAAHKPDLSYSGGSGNG
jgi:hypothetical protein